MPTLTNKKEMRMMKRVMLALLALAVTVGPTFAAEESAPGMKMDMKHMEHMEHMKHQNPEMKQQMMQNPQHMLAMAYHKNLEHFAMVLKKMALKADTIPPDFARAAVTEM